MGGFIRRYFVIVCKRFSITRMTGLSNVNSGKEKITEHDLPQTFIVKLLGRRDAKGLWGIKNTREPVDSMIAIAKERNLSLPLVQLTVTKEGVLISPPRTRRVSATKSDITDSALLFGTDVNANEIEIKNTSRKSPVAKSNFFSTLKFFGFRCTNSKNEYNVTKDMHLIMKEDNDKHENRENLPKKEQLETNFEKLENLKRESRFRPDRTFLGIDTISYGVQDLVFTRVFSMITVSEDNGRSPFQCYAFVCEDKHIARSITYSLSASFQIYSRTMKASRPVVQFDKATVTKPKILAIDLRSPEDQRGIQHSEA